MPMTLDAALRAISAALVEAREALDDDPESLASRLVVIGDLVGDAMAALVRSSADRAMQSEVAGNLATIMEAVRGVLRALKADERGHVADALGVMSAAVSGALVVHTRAGKHG